MSLALSRGPSEEKPNAVIGSSRPKGAGSKRDENKGEEGNCIGQGL